MGSWLSYVWWGGDPDAPDAVTGLSLRDLHLLRKTWAPIYKHRIENGTEILRRLFRAEPDAKEPFRMLRGVGEPEWGALPQFQAHVLSLMSALHAVLGALDRPPLAVALLDKVGESHHRRKVPKRHFEVLQGVLVGLLTELGLSRDALAAWGRALAFMYRHILPHITGDRSR